MFGIKACLSQEYQEWIRDANEALSFLEEQIVAAMPATEDICETNPKHLQSLFDMYRHSGLRRLLAVSNGLSVSWNAGNMLVCTILARSLLESIAVQHFFINEFEKYMSKQEYDKAYHWVASNVLAVRTEEIGIADQYKDMNLKKLHISDAIRNISKTYETFEKEYSWLSDFTHPNFLGVTGVFSRLDKDEGKIVFSNDNTEEMHVLVNCLGAIIYLPIFVEDWKRSEYLSGEIVKSGWRATENLIELFERVESA